MKKKLTSLILCAVLIFTMVVASACSYNWNDAYQSVSLNIGDALTGTIATSKKIEVVDKAMIDKVIHDLAAQGASSRDLRDTDALLEGDDKVTFGVTIKEQLEDGKETALTPDVTSYTFKLTDAQTGIIAEAVRAHILANLTGESAVKVGKETTIKGAVLIATAKTANNKTTYTFEDGKNTDGSNKENAKIYNISFTVSTAKIADEKVLPENGDILTIYYVSQKGDEAPVTSYNWSYDFGSNKLSGGTVFDPATSDEVKSTKPLYDYIVAGKLPLMAAPVLRAKDDVIAARDFVKITVTATYLAEDGTTKVEIADVKKMQLSFDLAGTTTANDVVTYLRDQLKTGTFKVGEEGSFKRTTFVKEISGKPDILWNEQIKNDKDVVIATNTRFYDATSEGVTAKEVTFEYKIESAYGSGDWGTWTDTETNTRYDFYVTSIKKLADTTKLDILTNSSVANGTTYENGDTRYLYVNSHEEKDEDGKTVIGTHYDNYYYGIELFLKKEIENEDKTKKTVFVDDEGNEISYTFVGDTEATTIDTEEKAVRYAIEKYLLESFEDARKKYATASMWKLLLEKAVLFMPQKLYDDYYNEYYENARYTFYKVNGGAVKVSVGEGSEKKEVTITDFDQYLLHITGATAWEGVRPAVNKKADEDLKPRLVIYTLAAQLGVGISEEEYNIGIANAYSNYMNEYSQQYLTYYQYWTYFQGSYSSIEEMLASMGYPAVGSVEDYVEIVLYGKENAVTGMLYDKVMEKLYEDAEKEPYKVVFDLNGPKTEK